MSVWPRQPFGTAPLEIIDGDRGKNYPGQNDFADTGHCLFLDARNVTADGFRFDECQFISEQKDLALRKGRLERDDVVLTTRGTVGNVAHFAAGVPFDRIRINSGMVILRADSNKLLPRYLFHFLRSPDFRGQVHSLRTGVAQPQLPIRDIRRIALPQPPVRTQCRIADTLSAYDGLIENNRRRMALLEDTARLVYQEWFVRFRFPGHARVRVTKGVPDGWQTLPFASICPDFREAADPADLASDTPYIGLEHMPRRSITLSEWGTACEVTSTKLKYQPGDVLFGKIRPYFHKVGIALTAGVTSSDAIVLRTIVPEHRAFALLTVSSDWFVAVVSKTAKEGAKMPRADWNLMAQHPIVLPPQPVVAEFNTVAVPIIEQLRVLALSNRQLRAARDLLLPRLMSGEIEV